MSRAAVFDINILVSAGLRPDSAVAALVERALMRDMPIHICPSILAEYEAVLARPKFRRAGFPPVWLPRLVQVAFHEPEPDPWPLPGPDADDLIFLALAKVTGAVLVSGNISDFPSAIRRGVTVMAPGDYLREYPA